MHKSGEQWQGLGSSKIVVNSILTQAFIFPDWRVLYFLAGGDDAGLRGEGGVRDTLG